MGILNVTPDSFSDGGAYLDEEAAVARGLELIGQGADILDVGGESSRPGAAPLDVEEELRRVVPVIARLRGLCDRPISVDTVKAEVARRALQAGADIVNDISALSMDPGMVDVARETGAGIILMHMQGRPRTMQANPVYKNVVEEVKEYLQDRIKWCLDKGVDAACLAVDPGIGFGKTCEHNLQLLANARVFCRLGRPVVVGASRKSFIGALTGRGVDGRLPGSLAVLADGIRQGVHIMRVHDVKESCEAARVVDSLVQASGS
ncbi:MAG: dihydropteroate synthase [Spartobacteria bacterium]|nr:dihydropteroate synthase [Spartobacteria bacterium]